MAIQTTVAPRQTIRLVAMAVICAALGLWGLYDYAIKIPRNEAAATRYTELTGELQGLAEVGAAGQATPAQRERGAQIEDELATFGGTVPEPPGKYDRAINLWLYIVGCLVLGVPWSLWLLWSMSRKRYRLDDDGTLHHPGGAWPASEVTGIDMSRWMEKSIATVQRRDGATLPLDDYKYRNIHLIVGHYASRFHPTEWTDEARLIKPEASGAAATPAGGNDDPTAPGIDGSQLDPQEDARPTADVSAGDTSGDISDASTASRP